ncbi:MAG: mechanosensitive ion channel family protein [Chloroflexota bacterium]|jgi:small-conductance mechanosensitive channel
MNEALATILATISAAIVILLAAWFGGKLIGVFLGRLARRTPSDYGDGLVAVWRPLIGWLIAALGFALAAAWLGFLDESGRWLFGEIAFFLSVVTIAEGSRRWVEYSLDHYVETRGDDIDTNVANQLVPLSRRLASMVILIVAGIVIAGHLGIDVVAIGAALGLTGFAIALALKDTITNIFSGLVIMISRPFAIGDRVEIPTLGTWADVTDIGIRSTTVVTRDNRFVIVPNSAVVDNAVINYSRPDSSYRLQLDIGLDPKLDMRAAQEAIRSEVRGVDGVLPHKPVDVWFTGFGDSDNTVRVRWWVETYATWRASTDAVANAIVDVTSREGISMPDPKMTLDGRLVVDPASAPESTD